MHPRRGSLGHVRRHRRVHARRTRSTSLLAVGVAWFVYATHRATGPTARSFRVFLIAGLAGDGDPHGARVLRHGRRRPTSRSPRSRACGSATILVVFGTFNAVTDPFGVVRLAPRRFHEPALAAALALSIAPRTIAAAQRVREAQTLRGIACPAAPLAARARGSGARDRDGGGRDARGEHGRARARPRHAIALPAATLDTGRSIVADRRRRSPPRPCSSRPRSRGAGELHPVDVPVAVAARRPPGSWRRSRCSRSPALLRGRSDP